MLTSPLCRLLPSYRASNRRRPGAARGDRSRRRPNRGGTGSAAGVLRLLRGRNGAERCGAAVAALPDPAVPALFILSPFLF